MAMETADCGAPETQNPICPSVDCAVEVGGFQVRHLEQSVDAFSLCPISCLSFMSRPRAASRSLVFIVSIEPSPTLFRQRPMSLSRCTPSAFPNHSRTPFEGYDGPVPLTDGPREPGHMLRAKSGG